MSKTVDELIGVYIEASNAVVWEAEKCGLCPMTLDMQRAGIAAVIRALRDAVILKIDAHNGCGILATETAIDATRDVFNEILDSDAGNEKVAGACADGTVVQRQRYGENDRQSKDGAEVSPRHPDPATDPAPAVCEWVFVHRMEADEWTDYRLYRQSCDGEEYATRSALQSCPSCGKPIKFTEAK